MVGLNTAFSSSHVNGNAAARVGYVYYSVVPPEPGSYIQYNLSALPDQLGVYDVVMNAPAGENHCAAVSYLVLDENQQVVDSLVVDHTVTPIQVGRPILKQGYAIRIGYRYHGL